MLSCDSFAIPKWDSAFGQNILVKNSDRPLGEAQPLVWIPGATHKEGETVSCTHLTIPQARETYGVLGFKPYWIWGFEMGINQWGVVIGNEAQGSRDCGETQEGLLGMDMLRLGLERGKSAYEAMHVIIAMLEEYGQNANASQLFDRRYENSFLLMDSREIWLLETIGRRWAAKRVKKPLGISNCYAIREDAEEMAADLETYSREKGWTAPEEPFDFAKACTKEALRQMQSVPRFRRLNKLLGEAYGGKPDFTYCKKICRDHFEGEILEPRFGAGCGTFVTICMHAGAWDRAQTAASLMVSSHEELGIVGRAAFSIPCCSAYMPIYWSEFIPEPIQTGGERYAESSLWWTLERLSMLVSIDYERFSGRVRETFDRLEADFEREALENEPIAIGYLRAGEKMKAFKVLNSQMERHCARIMETARRLSGEIVSAFGEETGIRGVRGEFLEEYGKRVGMPLLKEGPRD